MNRQEWEHKANDLHHVIHQPELKLTSTRVMDIKQKYEERYSRAYYRLIRRKSYYDLIMRKNTSNTDTIHRTELNNRQQITSLLLFELTSNRIEKHAN